jgi:hypothetical protein
MAKPDYKAITIEFLAEHPGSTEAQIMQELRRRSCQSQDQTTNQGTNPPRTTWRLAY